MVITTAGADLELIDGDTVVPLMLARPRADDGGIEEAGPLTISEALVASGAGLPLSEWLEPAVVEDWFPGVGIAYDAAPGCDTFSAPGYVLPGGAATDWPLPTSGSSPTPIIALAEFRGDVYAAQVGDGTGSTARVLRSVGGTAPFADTGLPAGAGQRLKDLLVARDSSTGTTYLWCSSADATGGNGRMHRWDGTGPWVSTPAGALGTWGRLRMVKVYWEGEDGVGDWRIVALASEQGWATYTRPGGNPMTPADWVAPFRVGGGEDITSLIAARRHVYLLSAVALYDLDELGNSPALTSYGVSDRGNLGPAGSGGGLGIYFDGHVFRPYATGIDRVRVDQGPVLSEAPGMCSPGWGTKAESGWLTAYLSAIGTHAGGVVAAMFAVPFSRVGLFWGASRETLGVETPNPLVWHGPFAIGPNQQDATRMLITSKASTPSATNLWIATWPTDQASPPKLTSISLPAPGGALQDLKAGGGHRYATGSGTGTEWQEYSRLEGLATTAKDKGSVKYLHQLTVGSRGLGDPAGTKLTAYLRADAPPTVGAPWGTGTDVTAGPTQDITPETTSGHKVEIRVDLFSPSGAATPPKPAILDSLRATFWRTAPDLDTWTFDVEYGPGVSSLSGGPWTTQALDVAWYTEALIAMARGGRVVMRDRQDNRWAVKLKHYLPRESILHEDAYGRTVRARITLAILEAAP